MTLVRWNGIRFFFFSSTPFLRPAHNHIHAHTAQPRKKKGPASFIEPRVWPGCCCWAWGGSLILQRPDKMITARTFSLSIYPDGIYIFFFLLLLSCLVFFFFLRSSSSSSSTDVFLPIYCLSPNQYWHTFISFHVQFSSLLSRPFSSFGKM